MNFRNEAPKGMGDEKTVQAEGDAKKAVAQGDGFQQSDNARGETRTRKTLESGDFESPASTNSATRASLNNLAAGRRALNDRAAVRVRRARRSAARAPAYDG